MMTIPGIDRERGGSWSWAGKSTNQAVERASDGEQGDWQPL